MTRTARCLFYVLLLTGCFRHAPVSQHNSIVSHQQLDMLLSHYVDDRGLVNYDSFQVHRPELKAYLKTLSSHVPSSSWSQEDRIAYWINAYNAFTIDLILEHKIPPSIKDVVSGINIPYVNSPWQIDFIELGDKVYDLDDIEHGILRRDFMEPRIHFALVRASRSCPPLRREAYVGEKLDEQLTQQAEFFLADTTRNKIEREQAQLSKVFQWYGADFAEHATLLEYVNQYSPVLMYDGAHVRYLDYDWSLNRQ